MQALKTLVIAMGLLIVVGIGFVGYGLMRAKNAPQTQQAPVSSAAEPFAARVPVPPGARLEQVTAAGDRIVLRFSSAEGEKLVLLDTQTGRPAGTISLVPDTH